MGNSSGSVQQSQQSVWIFQNNKKRRVWVRSVDENATREFTVKMPVGYFQAADLMHEINKKLERMADLRYGDKCVSILRPLPTHERPVYDDPTGLVGTLRGVELVDEQSGLVPEAPVYFVEERTEQRLRAKLYLEGDRALAKLSKSQRVAPTCLPPILEES